MYLDFQTSPQLPQARQAMFDYTVQVASTPAYRSDNQELHSILKGIAQIQMMKINCMITL